MVDSKFAFERLKVWQLSKEYVMTSYDLLKQFPDYEKFGLCNQIRRAVISIPSNIAEGSGRMSIKEQLHFISIAYGSLMEVYCQFSISKDLSYITDDEFKIIKAQTTSISKMLNALRAALEDKLPPHTS
ncbi:MAG: four helix bundle protein [Bacteroidales bacterium]|nr:four helix bundle protein [Bacteroidales bacterium]